jgi:mTERF domain-containing protein
VVSASEVSKILTKPFFGNNVGDSFKFFNAFKKQPNIMLRSPDKLNAVMRFWIKQFGWDPLVLLAAPDIFGFSIEKRLIPRASVVQYLLSKGLMKKDASLVTPFYLTDELFRQRYVNRFKEEAYRLLKLYQGEDSSIRCLDKLSKHV